MPPMTWHVLVNRRVRVGAGTSRGREPPMKIKTRIKAGQESMAVVN
jgi:hypothetical protein